MACLCTRFCKTLGNESAIPLLSSKDEKNNFLIFVGILQMTVNTRQKNSHCIIPTIRWSSWAMQYLLIIYVAQQWSESLDGNI